MKRTLPLALRPVSQMVTPFWLRRDARSAEVTDPGKVVVRSDGQGIVLKLPGWKVMFVAMLEQMLQSI